MLEIILAKLNPSESKWIKKQLGKDPFRREEILSELLGVTNIGGIGANRQWDGEGPYNSKSGKVFDLLEYKTSQAKTYNGTLKFHDYPEAKTFDWIDDNVLLLYATFVDGEIECIIGIAPIVDNVVQPWVFNLQNQVGCGVSSPYLTRREWEDSAVCLEYFSGEFKDASLYSTRLQELIMNLHNSDEPTLDEVMNTSPALAKGL